MSKKTEELKIKVLLKEIYRLEHLDHETTEEEEVARKNLLSEIKPKDFEILIEIIEGDAEEYAKKDIDPASTLGFAIENFRKNPKENKIGKETKTKLLRFYFKSERKYNKSCPSSYHTPGFTILAWEIEELIKSGIIDIDKIFIID